jgi:nickel transport protein
MRPVVAALALLALPAAGRAHEILHEVERGRAIAIRVYEADGELVANAPFQIFSPDGGATAWASGRTDRNGWLSFVPDAPGTWHVKVVGDDGHGVDARVEVTASAATPRGTPVSGTAFILRPLIGVAAIAALFAGLFAVYRKKGPKATVPPR